MISGISHPFLWIKILLRQTRAALLPRKDFANIDCCRRFNRLEVIHQVNTYPITTLGDWELKSFVLISRIMTLGRGLLAKWSRNSWANCGMVNPLMPCNDTVAVCIELKSTAARRLNLHRKSEWSLLTKEWPAISTLGRGQTMEQKGKIWKI